MIHNSCLLSTGYICVNVVVNDPMIATWFLEIALGH